jgi:hypothetical protein
VRRPHVGSTTPDLPSQVREQEEEEQIMNEQEQVVEAAAFPVAVSFDDIPARLEEVRAAVRADALR